MELSEVFIYRITHVDNIPHIFRYGITHRDSPNANPFYRAIGDSSLIDTRNNKRICVNNGQFTNSSRKIILGQYIPFYFGIRMPMLYVIQHGGNSVPTAVPPDDIVYLVCRAVDVIKEETEFYYTDGHATEFLTSVYDVSHIQLLPDKIDWQAVKAKYWGGSENLLLKAKKQAEFLVKHDIRPELIHALVCYSSSSKDKLVEMGVDERKIKIYPDAYF